MLVGINKRKNIMTKNIATSLIAAKKNFKPIAKSKTNPHFKSKYASLDSILDAITDALSDAGLVLIQPTSITAEGVSIIKTILIHAESNDRIESELALPTVTDPQKLGSALTYYRRYGICNLLAIAPDEDDDGQAAKPTPPPAQTTATINHRQAELNALKAELDIDTDTVNELIHNNIKCKIADMSTAQFDRLKELMQNTRVLAMAEN
jgi:hypothetical protein